MNNPILETPRLQLRRFQISDTEAVYQYGSNLEVNKYTGEPPLKSLAEARNIITNVNFQDYKKYGYGRWAVVYKEDNLVIGFAGLKYLPEFDETDIGYRFLPEYWGKGIATEASLPIIKYGFERLELNRIIGIADPENFASCKVLEKIGMKFYQKSNYEDSQKIYNWYKIEKEKI